LTVGMYPNYGSDMTQRQPLHAEPLRIVLGFIAKRGLSRKTFGAYAVNDSSFVDRLEIGKTTFAVADRALDYIEQREAAAAATSSEDTASVGPNNSDADTDNPDFPDGSRKLRGK